MKKCLIFILLLLLTGCKDKTYTVTFTDNYSKLSSIEIKKGDSLKNIDKPIKEGYLFLNWVKDGREYNINDPIYEDITLEASWMPIPKVTKTYQVIFKYGNEEKSMSVKEGEKVSKPSLSFKEDKYKFSGWYLDNELYDFDSIVKSDLVLNAKFEKIFITINYDLDGGSGIKGSNIEKGSIPKKPDNPNKFGYSFTKWTIDDNEYNFDYPIEDDVIIKANYVANVYFSVMFDTDGGSNIPSKIVLSGDVIDSLDIPKKDGYTFLYWSLDDKKFDINTKIDKDITLVAIYRKND